MDTDSSGSCSWSENCSYS